MPSFPTYSKTSSTQFHTSSSNNCSSSVVSFPPLPSPRPTTNHSKYRFAASGLVFRSSERMTNSSAFRASLSRSALSLPRPAAPVGRRCRVGCEDVNNYTTRIKAPSQREHEEQMFRVGLTIDMKNREYIHTLSPLSTSFPASHAAHFFTKVDLSCLRLRLTSTVEAEGSVQVGASIENICPRGSTTDGSTYVPSVRLFHIFR